MSKESASSDSNELNLNDKETDNFKLNQNGADNLPNKDGAEVDHFKTNHNATAYAHFKPNQDEADFTKPNQNGAGAVHSKQNQNGAEIDHFKPNRTKPNQNGTAADSSKPTQWIQEDCQVKRLILKIQVPAVENNYKLSPF